MKPTVPFSDFAKLDLRAGKVVEATLIEGSEKLIKLTIDLGAEIGTRTIYAGIKAWYSPETLVGRKFMFVVNLEPKKFHINGQELVSEGMLLAAVDSDSPVLYSFDKDIPSGAMVR